MLPFLVTLFPIIERSRSLFKSGEQNEFTKTENERTNGVQSQIFFVIRELVWSSSMCEYDFLAFRKRNTVARG